MKQSAATISPTATLSAPTRLTNTLQSTRMNSLPKPNPSVSNKGLVIVQVGNWYFLSHL